jgi:quinoprotein glucose dehydrogenase
VKSLFAALAVVTVLCLVALPLPADKFDFNQDHSPPKPTPQWVRLIDQGQNDPRLKGYVTPEGVKLEVVADFPTVTNPVGMTFADDGTLYVLEWRPSPGPSFPETPEEITYKDGSKRKIATMKKQVKDVVKVLTLNKDKGVYDQAKVILEDELPSSILLHDGWLYLSGRGTVRRYRQSKAGGPYDVKEVVARGFCGFHHHQVSGLTIGNDGWLYVTSGDNDNYVEGSDGSRATVLRTGAVFRCRPDGSKMHVYSLGYRNPYRDVAFDPAGNIFHADNDNEDGSKFQGCRLMHVAEESDFGWRLFPGATCCRADPVRGAAFGELPGKLPPLLKTGRGAPAGLLVYNDTRFPEPYRGLLYYPDVYRKLVRAYRVEPAGSTFAVAEEFEFLKSSDPLFRPCQMVTGPDGAMYVCDWRTDSGGAGQLWGDGKHGRIWRLSWAGTKETPAIPLRGLDSWDKIVKSSDEELLKQLAAEDATDRQAARREVVRRGVKQRPALLKLLADGAQPLPARIAALGALQAFWSDEVRDAFVTLLDENEPALRRLAADGLALNCAPGDETAQKGLLQVLGDSEPAVKRAVALAMGRIAAPGAADSLVNALAFDDGKDLYLRDAIVRGLERLGKPGIERLLALAESGSEKGLDHVVDAFTALRTRAGAEALPTLLKNPHLTVEQRAVLAHSWNNYLLDPPVSLQPLLDHLTARDEALPVKYAGLAVLAPGCVLAKDTTMPVAEPLKSDRGQAWLLGLLGEKEPVFRRAVLKAIEQTRPAKAGPALVELLRDGSRPAEEHVLVVRALRNLGNKDAVPLLKEFLKGDGPPRPGQGLLQAEALQALGALDPAAAESLARDLVSRDNPVVRKAALEVLGSQAGGAKHLGRLFLDRKLPRELLPQVSEVLRRHAARDREAADLLAAVMKSGLLVSTDKAELERLRDLVRTKGDPRRGRALYLNGKTLACINCHRMEGVGGEVGPDLTRLWDTHSVEKIIESILEPSKEIKEGYQTYQATTKKGLVYTGLKVAQNADEVILRDANGKDVRIPTKDLDELTASKQSLMPDNVVALLSYDQFLDLIAFLKDQKAQESLRGLVLDYLVVGPFGADLKTAYPPEKNPDPAATYDGDKPGAKLSWQPQQAEPSGYLNLKATSQRDNASAYALTYVYSPQAQKVRMLAGSDDTLRVWINGALVHEYATPRSARPDDDRVEVTLQEGWNPVLAKVVNLTSDHGLYLRFDGQGLRVSRTPPLK